jgi:hypothetical protein
MTRQWHGGKGSTPRSSNKQKYEENYDKIFKNNKEVKKKEVTKVEQKPIDIKQLFGSTNETKVIKEVDTIDTSVLFEKKEKFNINDLF